MNPKHPKYIGILFGVLYGISIRLLWEIEALKGLGSLVSISFMFLVPFVIGFIRVHFECRVVENLAFGKMVTIAWQPIFVFFLVSILTLLEGSICVAMALPAFMFFASLGGLSAGSLNYYISKRKSGSLLSVAVIPLLIAPIEVNLLKLSKTYEVKNSITIQASAKDVWSQLANVKTIDKNDSLFL